MVAVLLDMIPGASLESSRDGMRVVRVAEVSGLTAKPGGKEYQAVTASGVPQLGERHPFIPGIEVLSHSAKLHDQDSAEVTISYGRPKDGGSGGTGDRPIIFVGSTVQETQTNIDRHGHPITVPYDYKNVTPNRHVDQGGTVSAKIPMTVLRLRRREKEDPRAKSRQYVGRLNQAAFAGGGPLEWMCTRLEGQSDDLGKTYVVDYEFQHNPDKWDPVIPFIDPETGNPPTDAKLGDGMLKVEVYDRANFAALALGV